MKYFKKYKNMVRPFDIIIVIFLVVLSFTPNIVSAWQYSNIEEQVYGTVAIVSINGVEVDRFVLGEDTPHQLITYTHESGLMGEQFNIIEVDGTRIRVKEDNSPNQVAVRTGWIEQHGQTIICLPHRLVIRTMDLSPDVDHEGVIISS